MFNWKKILCCGAAVVMMTGCSTESDKKEVSKNPVVAETPQPTVTSSTEDVIEDAEIRMISAYLEEGKFSESVSFGGLLNDTNQVVIKEGKIALPKGEIQTMVMGDDAREEQFVHATADDVCKILDIIENAEYQKNVMKKYKSEIAQEKLHIDTVFVYENEEGEQKVLKLRTVGAGCHSLQVLLDDIDSGSRTEEILNTDTGKEVEVVEFYSEELTQLLKNCIGWKEVTNKQFAEIASISVFNVLGEQIGEELTEEELTEVKRILATATDVEKADTEICGTDYYLNCKLQDGETIYLGMSGDGCGFVATEGHLYQIANQDDVMDCIKIFTTKPKE